MFVKALGLIKGLLGGAGLLAPVLAAFGVVIPPVAIALLPLITSLMTEAEELFPQSGEGTLKKEAVTAGVVSFTEIMKTVSTGGQKETWNSVTPEAISLVIDTVATVANGISEEVVFDDSQYQKSQAF